MDIVRTFEPGALGAIISLHAAHYATHWGFGTYFEAKVAGELASFAVRKTEDDLVLLARDDGGVAGSLILDLHDPDSMNRGAHLRWFLLSERCRGTGLGRRMMTEAMAHVDAKSGGRCWLTTFAGLDAARHLYEAFGFTLAIENEGRAWGTPVLEQEFRRAAPSAM